MTTKLKIELPRRSAARRLAALSYIAIVAAMIALSIWFVADFFDRSNAVATARERLA